MKETGLLNKLLAHTLINPEEIWKTSLENCKQKYPDLKYWRHHETHKEKVFNFPSTFFRATNAETVKSLVSKKLYTTIFLYISFSITLFILFYYLLRVYCSKVESKRIVGGVSKQFNFTVELKVFRSSFTTYRWLGEVVVFLIALGISQQFAIVLAFTSLKGLARRTLKNP